MKKIKIALLSVLFSTSISSSAIEPITNLSFVNIRLTFQTIDKSKEHEGPHRTPAQVPNVYFNQESSTILFEAPCYECTLELVIPGTETVAYSYTIPDGDDTVQLPDYLSGEYELHIHRGNFCFWGTIEL